MNILQCSWAGKNTLTKIPWGIKKQARKKPRQRSFRGYSARQKLSRDNLIPAARFYLYWLAGGFPILFCSGGVALLRTSSGFLKRALAQTCLRAWYQVRFLDLFLGILGALCTGKGAPLVRYLCTTWESLHMFFTKRCPSGGTETQYVSFELFLGILRGPGEGPGGAPGTVPLQNPEVTSRKACLRNADLCVSRPRVLVYMCKRALWLDRPTKVLSWCVANF